MNFKQLEIFVCVAELGSFARAGERLYMTPSALTQQINALERYMGCTLLERSSKGSVLTAAGESFLDYAKQLLKLQKEAVAACSGAGSEPGVVRIGTCGGDTSILTEKIKQFAGICPDIQISFRSFNYREYFTRLENDELDLFVLPFDNTLDRKGLQFIPMVETRICCQMNRGHALAGRTGLDIADLRGRDLIVSCGCQSHCVDELVEYLEQYEPEIRLHRTKTENEVMDRILLEDYLMLNLSDSATQDGLYSYVPLDYPAPAYIGVIAKKKAPDPTARFLNFIRSTL